MISYSGSKRVTDTGLLSRQANTYKPRELSEYVKATDIKLSNLLKRLPENSYILDVNKSWTVTEYNAQGPLVYVYHLCVYYLKDNSPLYTQHTYEASMKHPDPEKEEYCLDTEGPRKVPKHSTAYKRLIAHCDAKTQALSIHNTFDVLGDIE